MAAGIPTTITSRTPASEPGLTVIPFDAAAPAIAAATHLITTAAPDEQGDPVLRRYSAAITASKNPDLYWLSLHHRRLWRPGRRLGRRGHATCAQIPPRTPPRRGRGRLGRFPVTVDIFRLAGIYGPGRSMFDDLRAGTGPPRGQTRPSLRPHPSGRYRPRRPQSHPAQRQAGCQHLQFFRRRTRRQRRCRGGSRPPAQHGRRPTRPLRTGRRKNVPHGAQLLGRQPPRLQAKTKAALNLPGATPPTAKA